MSYAPASQETIFLLELERIFTDEFLKAAPLYQAASKIKIPYEDIHKLTPMYRGALKEITRQVDTFADIHYFKRYPDQEEVIAVTSFFGQKAGFFVDGVLRAENLRSNVPDFTDAQNINVIDVFQHSDGRRNLQIFYAAPGTLTVSDPTGAGYGWFGYKFMFAAAAIVLDYKPNADTSTRP